MDLCVRMGAEISNWACRPRSDAYAWLHVMRTHRLQQWPSRFCCDLFVPFALSGHFRSELRLLYPETLKHTHQGIVRNVFRARNCDANPSPKEVAQGKTLVVVDRAAFSVGSVDSRGKEQR
ncbi:hypothetical protein PIB30_055154 [Stylosanthes scabra]|uniref:Uncharacterized protein n=1 Tax=Stylosanthes scabra TaxID=79078 RepID=A0ABU6SK51_9FABA|nr:hypothetical protein [Stylosanthes scabra]